MATCVENCNNWPWTVMTGGCLLVAFAPDGATGNDDDGDLVACIIDCSQSPIFP